MNLYRVVAAEVRHAFTMAGYRVRPYDMHLDARRWAWRRSGRQRSHDALRSLTAEQRAELDAALERAIRRREQDS